jgi:hypothetical protein
VRDPGLVLTSWECLADHLGEGRSDKRGIRPEELEIDGHGRPHGRASSFPRVASLGRWHQRQYLSTAQKDVAAGTLWVANQQTNLTLARARAGAAAGATAPATNNDTDPNPRKWCIKCTECPMPAF